MLTRLARARKKEFVAGTPAMMMPFFQWHHHRLVMPARILFSGTVMLKKQHTSFKFRNKVGNMVPENKVSPMRIDLTPILKSVPSASPVLKTIRSANCLRAHDSLTVLIRIGVKIDSASVDTLFSGTLFPTCCET